MLLLILLYLLAFSSIALTDHEKPTNGHDIDILAEGDGLHAERGHGSTNSSHGVKDEHGGHGHERMEAFEARKSARKRVF